jgi:threonine aldolase
MPILDLRSDTLTQPTEQMRSVMASAQVGDDVFGEDPTVKALERYAANLLGRPAGLFVPSGTMGNQIAMLCHCSRGDDVLVGEGSHSVLYEAGGGAAIGGVQFTVVGSGGHYDAAAAEAAISVTDPGNHAPNTTLLMVENSHNKGGGLAMSADTFKEIAITARRHNVLVHIDGARIFNAAAAFDAPASDWGQYADSVSFCLSKGLGAPVGSVLCGDERFIAKAHRFRKMLGGGMRQSGILAAAGLYALEHHMDDLRIDNERAKAFALGLVGLPHVHIEPANVQTNITIFDTPNHSAEFICEQFEPEARLLPMGKQRVRAVFHRDLPSDVVARLLDVVSRRLSTIK